MKKLIDFYTRLPAFIKNKYFVSITLFLIWMLFIDDYNMVFQWQKSRELAAIKEKKEYYEKEIQQVNQDRKDLFSSKANLEKYAREKYLMKRDDEDIFIIEENWYEDNLFDFSFIRFFISKCHLTNNLSKW